MSNFQTILVTIFITAAVLAVLIFADVIKIGTKPGTVTGKVVIWGTFNKGDIAGLFDSISAANDGSLAVTYVQKSKSSYQADLIESFAKGNGPDLFIITPDMIMENELFVYKIPYASFSEKLYRDTYIDGADIYLGSDGIFGLPLAVDPMVVYYNKNMFSNAGIAIIPSYWDELFNINNRLTQKEQDGTIKESMIALGQFDNVKNAKDILTTLIIQGGNNIVSRTDKGYVSTLEGNATANTPIVEATNFYTEFATPSTTAYSWNKSMPNSFDLFMQDKLAIYLGHASELFKIQSANPNLSFDVKQIFQARGVNNKRTNANIYAAVINKKSPNIPAALSVANIISWGTEAGNFSKAVSLPPSTRVLLSVKPTEPYLETFFNSAIISRSWLDPNYIKSDSVFREYLNNILSNKLEISVAINKANNQLDSLINSR